MADRWIRDTGGNYNSASTWESAPGAADVVSVPGSADAVRATATSGNLTVTAAAAAQNLQLASYTGTMTINSGQTLTVSGSVTLSSGMTVAGTGTLACATASTWTSAGKTITWNVSFTGAVTYTLADNWQVNGTTTISGNSATLNGFQLRMGGSVSWTGNTAGTTTYLLNGTGTFTGSSTSGRRWSTTLEINTAGTITIAGTGMQFGTTAIYTAGTINFSGSTCYIGGSASLQGAWPALNNLNVLTSSTLTLDNPLTVSGTLTHGNQTLTMAGNQNVSVSIYLATAATATLARGASGAWTITSTIRVSNSGVLVITGAQDMVSAGLDVQNGSTFRFQSGQILDLNGATVRLNGTSYATTTVRGETASSSFTMNLTGADVQCDYVTITDVIATGRSLYNYAGGTLTRTTNVFNFLDTALISACGSFG